MLGLLAGWSSAPEAIARAALVAGASVGVLGVVALRLEATDPPWLRMSMPFRGLVPARAAVVFAWLQPVVVPAFLALLVRQGSVSFRLLAVLEVEAALVAVAAAACSRWSMKGLAPYLVAAVGAWVAVVRLA